MREIRQRHVKRQAPVPEKPISANPGLKILFYFCIYLAMLFLKYNSMLSSLNLGVQTQKYFVCSSNIFLHKKTLRKIWLNPGLNLSIFRGTGPRRVKRLKLSASDRCT